MFICMKAVIGYNIGYITTIIHIIGALRKAIREHCCVQAETEDGGEM